MEFIAALFLIAVVVLAGVVVYDQMPAVAKPESQQLREIEQPERTDYPRWGKHRWNGHATLIDGVWVDDSEYPRPTRSQLRQFRRDYLQRTYVEEYTLIEGEQYAPMGRDGKVIKVRVRQSSDSSCIKDASGQIREYIPTIQITSLEPGYWWASSTMGTLPATFRRVVDRSKVTDGNQGAQEHATASSASAAQKALSHRETL